MQEPIPSIENAHVSPVRMLLDYHLLSSRAACCPRMAASFLATYGASGHYTWQAASNPVCQRQCLPWFALTASLADRLAHSQPTGRPGFGDCSNFQSASNALPRWLSNSSHARRTVQLRCHPRSGSRSAASAWSATASARCRAGHSPNRRLVASSLAPWITRLIFWAFWQLGLPQRPVLQGFHLTGHQSGLFRRSTIAYRDQADLHLPESTERQPAHGGRENLFAQFASARFHQRPVVPGAQSSWCCQD